MIKCKNGLPYYYAIMTRGYTEWHRKSGNTQRLIDSNHLLLNSDTKLSETLCKFSNKTFSASTTRSGGASNFHLGL